MRTYFCYVHLQGCLTPELRAVAAAEDAELPDMILADLTSWPSLDSVERIEVCTSDNRLMFSINPREAQGSSH